MNFPQTIVLKKEGNYLDISGQSRALSEIENIQNVFNSSTGYKGQVTSV